MLILKGDVYKSVIVSQLMRNKFNECIIWGEPNIRNIEFSWSISSGELNILYEYIIELNNSLGISGENRDLLIIYTNKTEEEIKPLIKWIEDQKKYLFFTQVLVTCK